MLKTAKVQPFKVNKTGSTVSSFLSIFEIKKTIKISIMKPTVNSKSLSSYKDPQIYCFIKSLTGAVNKQPH